MTFKFRAGAICKLVKYGEIPEILTEQYFSSCTVYFVTNMINISHYFTLFHFLKLFCLVFHNISHDIYQCIYVKYFVLYNVIYFVVFLCKSHDVYR